MAKEDLDEDILEDAEDMPDLDEAEDLDEDDLEELDDEEGIADLDDDDEDEVDIDVLDEEGEEDAPVGTLKPAREEDDDEDEEDEEDSDDVEASLDVILKERLVVVDDEDEEDDEDDVVDTDDRGESPQRVLPKQPGEFVCQSCFLVKHPSQLADADAQLCRDCV